MTGFNSQIHEHRNPPTDIPHVFTSLLPLQRTKSRSRHAQCQPLTKYSHHNAEQDKALQATQNNPLHIKGDVNTLYVPWNIAERLKRVDYYAKLNSTYALQSIAIRAHPLT